MYRSLLYLNKLWYFEGFCILIMFSDVFLFPDASHLWNFIFCAKCFCFRSPSLHSVIVYFILADTRSFFQSDLFYLELFVLFSIYTILKKSPCNTVLITVLPGAFFYSEAITSINIAYYFFLTITLSRCQISSTYSWIVLSDVNLPLHAVLRSAFLAQPFSSLYAASTRFCASA